MEKNRIQGSIRSKKRRRGLEMPSSAAERKRKQIEKLKKEGKFEEFKRRQSIMQKERRRNKKTTSTFDEKQKLKKKRTEEQRKYRKKKRDLLQDQEGCSSRDSPSQRYKSRSAFGKAVAKARRGLPLSPRKRVAVVKKLATQFSPSILATPLPPRRENSDRIISSELTTSIVNFYCSDSVSYQMPGARDCIIIRAAGIKEKVQKRYLFLTLGETYQQFKSEFPNAKIGLTRFGELRPQHVCLRAETPTNLCLCIYHENVRLILRSIPELPNSVSTFIANVVCNADEMECMMSECEVCGKGEKYDQYVKAVFPEDLNDTEVTYLQWLKEDEGRVSRKKLCATTDEILVMLKGKLSQFLPHIFIYKKQSSHFEDLKSSLSQGTILLQIDFSENYCFQYQDEIQSAHWVSQSCTLYTAIIYFSGENFSTSHESYVLVSDYLHHDKFAVAYFNDVIINDFKERHPEIIITRIHYQSDGTAQHFKQKYSLCLITLQKEETSWHFSATAHGKGPIDGLGGCVKRRVREATRARQIDPRNAAQFTECAQHLCPNINLMYCSENDITARKPELLKLWNYNTKEICSIPDTRNYHYFHSVGKYKIECSITSTDSSKKKMFDFIEGVFIPQSEDDDLQTSHKKEALCKKLCTETISIGDWVLVPFAGKKSVKYFIGNVLNKLDSNEIYLKFLRYDAQTSKFCWPIQDDEAYIELKDVKQKLPDPAFDQRLRYTFDFDFKDFTLG